MPGANIPANGAVPQNAERTDSFPIGRMLVAATYPHPVTALELRETHLSWIVLTGRYAYKIRKPVHYDFVDQSSFERRRQLCEEELRLNRRLAPELYLEVVRICAAPPGLRIGGDGPALEHAVKMLQFDNAQELPARLIRNAVAREEIAQFGALLADFHRKAGVAVQTDPFGSVDAVRSTVLGNLSSLVAGSEDGHDAAELQQLVDWTREELRRLEPLIARRKAGGFVRECHGDLHGRNIVWWRDRLVPFDALEFDPALRWIDVIDDIAFIFMDLISYRREDLAFSLLSAWLESSGDYEALPLLRFYAVYRALVRAKVDALQARSSTAAGLAQSARMHFHERLAVAGRLAAPHRPALMLMHGVSGSGKSWVSERLVAELGVVRVRSDLERKRLAGLAAGARSESPVLAGLYAGAMTERTYQRLLRCAEAALDGGIGIVIDAAFLDRRRRDQFRELAHRAKCGFLILTCHADQEVLARRLAQRAAIGHDASEAGADVLRHQLATPWQLAPEEVPNAVGILTTAADGLDRVLPQIRERLRAAEPAV